MDDFNQDDLETFEEYLFSKSFLEQDDDIDISNIRELSSITLKLIKKLEMKTNTAFSNKFVILSVISFNAIFKTCNNSS